MKRSNPIDFTMINDDSKFEIRIPNLEWLAISSNKILLPPEFFFTTSPSV